MRIWHKDLIDVLPKQQLIGQWRELCLIAKNMYLKGTPNHILVNPVISYTEDHLVTYTALIFNECKNRGIRVNWNKSFGKWFTDHEYVKIPLDELFAGWHNDRYLLQCFYNLQEKFDRGGIPEDEWVQVYERVVELNV